MAFRSYVSRPARSRRDRTNPSRLIEADSAPQIGGDHSDELVERLWGRRRRSGALAHALERPATALGGYQLTPPRSGNGPVRGFAEPPARMHRPDAAARLRRPSWASRRTRRMGAHGVRSSPADRPQLLAPGLALRIRSHGFEATGQTSDVSSITRDRSAAIR